MGASQRSRAKRALLRVPLPFRRRTLRAAWRARERMLSLRGRGGAVHDRGIPVPPARLRVLVSGTADADFFLRSGRAQSRFIAGLLERNGHRIGEFESILDFGCGCGRVARWWSELSGPRLHGCDYNEELVEWCSSNLGFLDAQPNCLEPPLPHPDRGFDLVYALSVFTHLAEPLQHRWIAELERVLRPGGLLLLTVSGDSYREKLSPTQRAAYERGSLITHFDEVAGTNMCAAFHPPAYVRERLLERFELVDVVPGSEQEPGTALSQDTYLARRPPGVR